MSEVMEPRWQKSVLRLVLAFLVVATSVAWAEDDDIAIDNAASEPVPSEAATDSVADDAELEAMLNAREGERSDLPSSKGTQASRETSSTGADDIVNFDEERPGDAERVYAIPEGGDRVPQFEDPREDVDSIEVLRFHRKLISERDKYRDPGEDDVPLTFHVGGGPSLLADANYGAQLDFQFAFTRHFSLGVVAYYASVTNQTSLFGQAVNGSVNVYGAGAALNFYSRQPYEGIWIQAGAGYDLMHDANVTLNGQVPLFFTFGWRFLEDHHNLTFGFGAGARTYFFAPEPRVMLTLKLEIGFGWNVFPH